LKNASRPEILTLSPAFSYNLELMSAPFNRSMGGARRDAPIAADGSEDDRFLNFSIFNVVCGFCDVNAGSELQ
jgi:hypothetical protein